MKISIKIKRQTRKENTHHDSGSLQFPSDSIRNISLLPKQKRKRKEAA